MGVSSDSNLYPKLNSDSKVVSPSIGLWGSLYLHIVLIFLRGDGFVYDRLTWMIFLVEAGLLPLLVLKI